MIFCIIQSLKDPRHRIHRIFRNSFQILADIRWFKIIWQNIFQTLCLLPIYAWLMGKKLKNGIQNSHASAPLRLCRKRTQCQLSTSRFFKIYKQFSDLSPESDLVAMQWGNISISAATQGTTADNSRQQLTTAGSSWQLFFYRQENLRIN